MKIKQIDYKFWIAWQNCPSKACYASLFGRRLSDKRMTTEPTYGLDTYEIEIIQEILLTSMLQLQYKKELTYKSFYLILTVILKKHKQTKIS